MFSNLFVFRLTQGQDVAADTVDAALLKKPFQPCGSQDMETSGWTFPNPYVPERFVQTSSGAILVALLIEKKVLPAAAVNHRLDQKVAEIQQREERKIGKKEKKEIKEAVMQEMLPHAPVTQSRLMGIIDGPSSMLYVNTANAKAAEAFAARLVGDVEGLGTSLLSTTEPPTGVMTTWLVNHEAPAPFVLGDAVTLKGDNGAATFKSHDLTVDQVQANVKDGKQVVGLALAFDDRLDFKIDDKGIVKGIKVRDVIKDDIKGQSDGDAAALVEAELFVTVQESRRLLAALHEAFGGVEK